MNASRLSVLSLSLILTACAGGTEVEPNDGGGGTSSTSDGGSGATTSIGGGGSGAEGGGGGNTGSCEVDCSTITTPDCSVAECNEGQHPGTIGECVVVSAGDGTTCDDGLFCTTADACLSGVCTGGPPNDCGMAGGACDVVTCDEGSATCSSTPANNGTTCTPADLCTVNGTCTNGLCVGQPMDCFFAPKGECEVALCDPADGMCKGQADPTQDGSTCTDVNDLCSDGNTCLTGVCSGGSLKDCSGLDVGCTVGVCDMMTGQCVGQAGQMGSACFDGIGPCETGTCDNMMNCVPAPVPNGGMCDDFSTCTINDVCQGGVCSGTLDPMCSTYFEEAFETCPPPGWTLAAEWECGAPTLVGPMSAIQGANLLGTDLDSDYENSQSYTTAYAQTPPIGLGTAVAPVLVYQQWVDTEGSVFDGYNVSVSTDGGMNYSVLQTVDPPYNLTIDSQPAYGGHTMLWEPVQASLAAYIGQQIILRFSFRSDGSVVYPGVYIDDVQVLEGDEIPITITTASLPNALENVAYSAQLDHSGGSGNGSWSIQPGGTNDGWLGINASSGQLTGTPAMANVGPVTVVIRHFEPSNPTNFDEAMYSFNVQSTIYSDDIEAACPGTWTLTGDWQCGAPTSGPNMALSGTQVLATQLAGSYNSNQSWAGTTASSGPISLMGTTAPQLRFDVWYQTETSFDGFNIKVSTDGGMTYAIVPMVTPIYNQTFDGQGAWSGSTGGMMWQQFVADLSAYVGMQVHLQFGFRSDGSVTYPGVYIDNVAITD
jgi:Immune inhibitor A-like, MAM domain